MTTIAVGFPDIAACWDVERNGKTPEEVGTKSSAVAYWKCTEHPSHTWEASAAKMTQRSYVCPRCQSVAFLFPNLLAEWDYEANGDLSPWDLSAGSSKEAHWVCRKNSAHRWPARVVSRSKRGAQCPICTGRKLVSGLNDLASQYPEVAAEWDAEANGDVTPGSVHSGSADEAHWVCSNNSEHRWSARISNRTHQGAGCRKCAAQSSGEKRRGQPTKRRAYVPSPERSFAALRPDLLSEWADPDHDPKTTAGKSNTNILWACPKPGHGTWRAKVCERTVGRGGCRVCSGKDVVKGVNDLATTHPELARQMVDPVIAADAINWRCRDKALWQCVRDESHRWRATVRSRADQGNGCSLCRGLLANKGVNDLATTHPHLLEEWNHPSIDPTTIKAGSGFRVRWKCSRNPAHEPWVTAISERAQRGTGCPKCAWAPEVGETDLATTHPHLLEEWADETVSADEVTAGSGAIVQWRCRVDQRHVWPASVAKRAAGSGCPACRGRLSIPGVNDLATTHPELAAEWNDAERAPSSVTSRSIYRATWKCSKNPKHTWTCLVQQRAVDGTGCPDCWRLTFTSKAENDIVSIVKSLCPDVTIVRNDRSLGGGELDIHVPERQLAIEFNGIYWHTEDAGRDREYHRDKTLAARAAGLQLVHVWEDEWAVHRDVVVRGIAHRLNATDRLGAPGVLLDPDPATWERLNARSLTVAAVGATDAATFLDANHVQGGVRATHHLALLDEAHAVRAVLSVMRGKSGQWSIERFATRGVVRGGFTRLLVAAERRITSDGSTVKSWATFADEGMSIAGLYANNGFVLDGTLPPDYRYVVAGQRVHKFNYRLKRFAADPSLDFVEGATERELAEMNGLARIWDCGKTRWVRDV